MRLRLKAAVTFFFTLASIAGAARHKKVKAHKTHARTAIHAVKRAASALAPKAAVRTGNAELDRLLAERPAPESWTDSVLTTPVAAMVQANNAEDSAAALANGTPLERIRSIADPWIGTRYRAGGNGEKGFDCSGFVSFIYKTFGVSLPGRSSPSYWTQGESIDEQELQPGDLVFFSDHTRRIGHVGIYLEDGKFVHASVQSGVIISAIDERYYRRRYKGARRIAEFQKSIGAVASR